MKKLLANPKRDLKKFQKCSTKGLKKGKYERHRGWLKGYYMPIKYSRRRFWKECWSGTIEGIIAENLLDMLIDKNLYI